jgi:hypothetical protein
MKKINEFKDESIYFDISKSKLFQDKLKDANISLGKIDFSKKMEKDEHDNWILKDEEIIKYEKNEKIK